MEAASVKHVGILTKFQTQFFLEGNQFSVSGAGTSKKGGREKEGINASFTVKNGSMGILNDPNYLDTMREFLRKEYGCEVSYLNVTWSMDSSNLIASGVSLSYKFA